MSQTVLDSEAEHLKIKLELWPIPGMDGQSLGKMSRLLCLSSACKLGHVPLVALLENSFPSKGTRAVSVTQKSEG